MTLRTLLKKLLPAWNNSRGKFCDDDDDKWPGLWRLVKYTYWRIIPYDWRPFQVWYRLKCFLFKRYTTIKPRTLKYHTWCDRCTLMPHMMFEILSQFIEQECSPGHIDWEGSGHTVDVNGKEVNVRHEMQDLYDWWHKVYLKEIPKKEEELWEIAKQHEPSYYFKKVDDLGDVIKGEKGRGYEYKPQFKTEEDDVEHHKAMKGLNDLERDTEIDLQERLHRLVEVIPYMWT